MTKETLQTIKEQGEVKINGVIYKYKAYCGWGEVRKRVGKYWGLVAKYNNTTDEWTMVA